MRISTGDIHLEARWDEPESADRAVVLCHPHPQQGGTMRAPLMHKVMKGLVARGLAVLRFNFRGVGESTGSWGDGVAEIDDVGAAMAEAAGRFGSAVALAGWSFGAAAALRWQADTASTATYVGIAPPVSGPLTPDLPEPKELSPAWRMFVLGDRDQFVPTAELEGYATSIGAAFESLGGSDHFFHFREQEVADLIVDFVLNERN